MESHEVLKTAICKVGAKAVAKALNLSESHVYKWCQPRETNGRVRSGTRNPLDLLAVVLSTTQDREIVNWLCRQMDGFFVPNAPNDADRQAQLIAATQNLIQGFSELLAEVTRSTAGDQCVSEGEARRIRREWEELKGTAESFVVACERGIFEG